MTFTLLDLTDVFITVVFITAKLKNETKIKTYLRARGPPGVSGALRSLRILRIGSILSSFKCYKNPARSR